MLSVFDAFEPADLIHLHCVIIAGYLAGLGFVIDLIMRREHDAVLSGGFLGTWSNWAARIYNTGFAPNGPDAQHLHGNNSSNVRYISPMGLIQSPFLKILSTCVV